MFNEKLKAMGFLDLFGDLAGGFMGAVGSAYSSNIAAKTAKYNTDQTILANRKMAEYEFSKNLEMWNKGNEYDSPEAQMQRLKDAGLNPNLVYGSGNVTGNSSGTLPQYHAPTAQYNYKPPVDWGSVINQFQDVQLKQAQIDNVSAQVKSQQISNDLANIEKEYQGAVILDRITKYFDEAGIKENEHIMSNIKRMIAEKTGEYEVSNRLAEITKTQNEAAISGHDKEIKRVAAEYAKANQLVNMITKGVGAAAGAVGAAGILRGFSSTARQVKNSSKVRPGNPGSGTVNEKYGSKKILNDTYKTKKTAQGLL